MPLSRSSKTFVNNDSSRFRGLRRHEVKVESGWSFFSPSQFTANVPRTYVLKLVKMRTQRERTAHPAVTFPTLLHCDVENNNVNRQHTAPPTLRSPPLFHSTLVVACSLLFVDQLKLSQSHPAVAVFERRWCWVLMWRLMLA